MKSWWSNSLNVSVIHMQDFVGDVYVLKASVFFFILYQLRTLIVTVH